jgi:arsenical pump membrane protein
VLFPLVVLLGGAIAAVFANDGAALLLTPIVVAILLRLDFSPAATLAFVVATGFVADTTSLPLIISNLVNIVSANFFGIGFNRYALVMIPVDIVALAATLGVLRLFYRRDIPATYNMTQLEAPASAIRDPLVFKAAFPMLAVLLVAYFALAPLGVPVSAVTVVGAFVLLALAGRCYRGGRGAVVPVMKVLRGAPWQIVIFSLGMYLVVYGLRNAGLTGYLATGLIWLAGRGPWAAAIGTGFGAALLSSVMNNMPGVLVGALSIEQAHGLPPLTQELMIYANIIGCDLGPKFTPIGSLATLLWLHVLARKGIRISWGQYMRVGLAITPPVLLLTLVALAAWLPVVGGR